MTYKLDQSIKLSPLGDEAFLCDPSEAYWNFSNAFGGWAVAVAVEAVSRVPNVRGDLLSVNATFPDALARAPLTVSTRKIRERARTDFWRVEFFDHAAPADPLFCADIVMAAPRSSEQGYQPPMPDIKAPEDIPPMPLPPGPQWLADYDQRLVKGRPFSIAKRPDSITWLRDTDGRPLDATGIASISDTFMPRIFFASNTMPMCSTVSYSLSLFASAAELAEIGNDFLLLEAESAVIANGAYDQRGRIRARSGRVLAVTNQVAFFR